MAKKTLAVAIVWLASIICAQADSGPKVHEGLWEITVEVEMPGMPMKMPPSTYTQCIKKDRAIPMDEKPGQQCKPADIKTSGNTVTWTMACTTAGGPMTGKGRITYHDDRMEGTMSMRSQGMTMISHYKGHRIGACE
jgi:hypothetical protein